MHSVLEALGGEAERAERHHEQIGNLLCTIIKTNETRRSSTVSMKGST